MFDIMYLYIWSVLVLLIFLGFIIFGVDPGKFSNEIKFISMVMILGIGWIMVGIQTIMARTNNHSEEAKKICPTCGKEMEK